MIDLCSGPPNNAIWSFDSAKRRPQFMMTTFVEMGGKWKSELHDAPPPLEMGAPNDDEGTDEVNSYRKNRSHIKLQFQLMSVLNVVTESTRRIETKTEQKAIFLASRDTQLFPHKQLNQVKRKASIKREVKNESRRLHS